MTLKERVAQLEAENAQLREQVIKLTDTLVKTYESLGRPPVAYYPQTPYYPQTIPDPLVPWSNTCDSTSGSMQTMSEHEADIFRRALGKA